MDHIDMKGERWLWSWTVGSLLLVVAGLTAGLIWKSMQLEREERRVGELLQKQADCVAIQGAWEKRAKLDETELGQCLAERQAFKTKLDNVILF